MSTIHPQTNPTEKHTAFALITVVVLILAPVIGLIMLAQRELTWKAPVKVIVTILTVLYLPVHAVVAISILYAGGSINHLMPNDTIAKQYLENRYHEEFVILRQTGSDQLGGSINYSKWVSPKNDPEIEFRIDKCLARCAPYESTQFTDTYPQKRWSRDLTRKFSSEIGLTDAQRISVYANSTKAAEIVDTTNGNIPNFYNLTAQQRAAIGVSIFFNESDGTYSMETRALHAERILALATLIRQAGAASGSITYDVKTSYPETAKSASKDTFHFTTDTALSLTSAEQVYPLFTAQTSGRGLIKEAYTLHQTQINVSKRQTMGAEGKPSLQQASKATLELELAKTVQLRIADRYVLPPYVIATIIPNEELDPSTLYSAVDPNTYSVTIAVYNYPNETVSISDQDHRAHIQALLGVLQDTFATSSLTYKTDAQTCKATDIKASAPPTFQCTPVPVTPQ